MNLENENKIIKKEYENQKNKAQSFTEKFERMNLICLGKKNLIIYKKKIDML